MPKNVVVCCDGTSNQFTSHPTNVVKLFGTLVKGEPGQVAYYHPGVGTMAPPGFVTLLGQQSAVVAGLALGAFLKDDVCRAYSFIADAFEPGDRLFIFGFSRGAYTARVLTALLHLYGLVGKGNDAFAPYIVRMLWTIRALERRRGPGAPPDPRVSAYFGLAHAVKAACAVTPCRPHFVGLWDTVSSVGWIGHPLSLPYTRDNPDIAIGRHAISIDERRAFFRPNLWAPAPPPAASGPADLKQVWFPGDHCDVGGGHPEPESGLSKIALEWMLGEATAAGLLVDPARVDVVLGRRDPGYAKPDPNAPLHDSLTGFWRLAEFVPKRHWDPVSHTEGWRINNFRRRTLPPRPLVHDAAWQRSGDYAARLPTDAVRLSSVRAGASPGSAATAS